MNTVITEVSLRRNLNVECFINCSDLFVLSLLMANVDHLRGPNMTDCSKDCMNRKKGNTHQQTDIIRNFDDLSDVHSLNVLMYN